MDVFVYFLLKTAFSSFVRTLLVSIVLVAVVFSVRSVGRWLYSMFIPYGSCCIQYSFGMAHKVHIRNSK